MQHTGLDVRKKGFRPSRHRDAAMQGGMQPSHCFSLFIFLAKA
jgi:hypothetical protein